MNELIKARNSAKKGSAAYATAQNAINKAYGSKKVHKADAPKVEKKAQGGKVESYSDGGKVESNPFGWPSRDARNGGKG